MKKKLAEMTQEYLNIADVILLVIKKDLRVELINKKGCDILGFKQEEIIGKNWLEFIPPEDRQKLEEVFTRIIEGKLEEAKQYENTVLTKNGERRSIKWSNTYLKDENGAVIGTLSSGEDITGSKAFELECIKNEKMFKSLVQNSSDPVAVIDCSGNYKYVSDAVKKILGHDPEDLLGRSVFDFLHPDDHPMIIKVLKNVIKDDFAVTKPFRFLHKDGEWKWLESNANNRLADPDVEGIIVNSRDVSERISLKQKLEKEQSQHQKKITAAVIKAQERERSLLGQELHDNVNQMLATVKLYNEMVLERIGTSEILSKSIYYIQESINEIRRITKHLAAPAAGNISLKESISDLIDSIHITEKIFFKYSIIGFEDRVIPKDLHLCIYRIFQEHLSNIIKHADSTMVTIELRYNPEQISFIMKDNGKGFDVMTKKNGIGIINMKTRAENLNGILEICSKPGNGCQMTASFPLYR